MVSGVDRLSFTIRSNSVQSRLIVANGAGKWGEMSTALELMLVYDCTVRLHKPKISKKSDRNAYI